MEKLNVLLVDDDDNLRFIGQISLEDGAGWQVHCAASGPEAIETAVKERHDGRLRREGKDPRRHLHERRLHPVQGAAARLPHV